MINKLLTTLNRNNIENKADLGEKIGNIGLGLLRIGFGKTVTVEKISDDPHKTVFTSKGSNKVYSTIVRVVAVALFILALPLTILLTGIGCVGTAFSKSHELANVVLQVRKIPSLGFNDTGWGWSSPSGPVSVHGSGELFRDSEIIEKLDIIERKEIETESDIYISYTKNGKAIIQQQATRGCTAAATAMLIVDNGKKPDLYALRGRSLANDEVKIRDIQKAGLKPVINRADDLEGLRNLIIQKDSCIVSVSGRLGGHVIVVDEVSKDLSKIRLRDPYHGWEITVNSEAFLKEWHGGDVIQIVKN